MKFSIILVLVAGLNATVANTLLKVSRTKMAEVEIWYEKFLTWPFFAAIFFHVIVLVLFAKALDTISVSSAYPILVGTGFISLALVSTLFLDEKWGVWHTFGSMLILGGIVILAKVNSG